VDPLECPIGFPPTFFPPKFTPSRGYPLSPTLETSKLSVNSFKFSGLPQKTNPVRFLQSPFVLRPPFCRLFPCRSYLFIGIPCCLRNSGDICSTFYFLLNSPPLRFCYPSLPFISNFLVPFLGLKRVFMETASVWQPSTLFLWPGFFEC